MCEHRVRAPCAAVRQGPEPRVGAQAGRPCARIEHDSQKGAPLRPWDRWRGSRGRDAGPSQRPLPEQSEACLPAQGSWPRPLAPWGLSRLPSTRLPRASDYTLGTSGAASGGLMETLSAAVLHVRGGEGRSRGWYCPRVVAGGVCRQPACMPSNTGEGQGCNLCCVQRVGFVNRQGNCGRLEQGLPKRHLVVEGNSLTHLIGSVGSDH